MDLPLFLRAPENRGGPLAHPTHGSKRQSVLFGAFSHFAEQVGAGKDKRILIVLDQAGWHTSPRVRVPEGLEVEFLPSHSPELQPSERLWPLTNEGVANRYYFEDIEFLEEALIERWVALGGVVRTARGHALLHTLPLVVPLVAGDGMKNADLFSRKRYHSPLRG